MAWDNLASQPTMDSSQTLPLRELETLPVITFCPQAGEINDTSIGTNLDAFEKYFFTEDFLLGELIFDTGIL